MTKQIFISLLLFSAATYSSSSLAGWENVGENISGDNYYIDFKKIKKNNGYVYYWVLRDYLKPDKWNDMSSKTLYEADCNTPIKDRKIYSTYHVQPMGNGKPSTISPDKSDWYYPSPDSMAEFMLETVCDR